jgi:branched-chain amino acid transport system substrate-binding protein
MKPPYHHRHCRSAVLALMAFSALLAAPAGYAYEAVVGIIAPRSGPMTELGTSMANGVTLALEIAEDSGSLPDGVALSLKQLDETRPHNELLRTLDSFVRDQEAVLLIGPMASATAELVARQANGLGVQLLTPSISERVNRAGPWSLHTSLSPLELVDAFANSIASALPPTSAGNPRKTLLIYPADNGGYKAQALLFGQRLGGTELAIRVTLEGIADTARQIQRLSPDVVLACIDAEPAGALAAAVASTPAARPLQWLFCPAAAQPALLRIGGTALENALIATDYLPEAAGNVNALFVSAYRTRFGIAPDRWAGIGYSTGLIAAEALRQAGPAPSRKTLNLAIQRVLSVPVPLGGGVWRQNDARNPHYAPAVFRIQGGAFVAFTAGSSAANKTSAPTANPATPAGTQDGAPNR